MLFSIIIPAYNCDKYVDKTIESVVQQKVNTEYEIIIIDDGSTDHTLIYVNHMLKNIHL